MANYTIEQALALRNLDASVKSYLETLQGSKLPAVKEKTFKAQNQTELLTVLQNEFERYTQAKAKRQAKTQCHEIINRLVKGSNGQRRLISPEELLQRLQALEEQIKQEKQYQKLNDIVETSGLTREQIIEYLQNK